MLYRRLRRTLAIIAHGQDQPCTRDEVGFGNTISAATALLCTVFVSTSSLDANRESLPPRHPYRHSRGRPFLPSTGPQSSESHSVDSDRFVGRLRS